MTDNKNLDIDFSFKKNNVDELLRIVVESYIKRNGLT